MIILLSEVMTRVTQHIISVTSICLRLFPVEATSSQVSGQH